MIDFIIIDIDGCLMDCSEMEFPEENTRAAWDEFHKQYGRCKPFKNFAKFIAKLDAIAIKRVFITSREDIDNVRNITDIHIFESLREAGVYHLDYDLLMRKADDYRPSNEVKRELYLNYIEKSPNSRAIVAIDDDLGNIKMWHSLGINTLHANILN